jgi:hypothetical protein
MQLSSFLKRIVAETTQSQQADGYWNMNWCGAVASDTGSTNPIVTRLLVTGHLPQMLNELDPQLRPPNTVFKKGAQWITQTLNSSDVHYDDGWLCPFTHGAMAHKNFYSRQ